MPQNWEYGPLSFDSREARFPIFSKITHKSRMRGVFQTENDQCRRSFFFYMWFSRSSPSFSFTLFCRFSSYSFLLAKIFQTMQASFILRRGFSRADQDIAPTPVRTSQLWHEERHILVSPADYVLRAKGRWTGYIIRRQVTDGGKSTGVDCKRDRTLVEDLHYKVGRRAGPMMTERQQNEWNCHWGKHDQWGRASK